MSAEIVIKHLGFCEYATTWQMMNDFTAKRDKSTPDEIWFLEHPPVFTQGMAGKAEHLLNPGNIPVVQTDRGGQITYHGPGQLMVYVLVDLRRRKLGVRKFVSVLENSVIQMLAEYNIIAFAKPDAPGVYVQDAKICSIGLRIRNGCSYHGIALNVNMDLEPFSHINPCGFKNLRMTQIRDYVEDNLAKVTMKLEKYLVNNFQLQTLLRSNSSIDN